MAKEFPCITSEKIQSAKAGREIEIAFKLIEAELENHLGENKAKRAVGSAAKRSKRYTDCLY